VQVLDLAVNFDPHRTETNQRHAFTERNDQREVPAKLPRPNAKLSKKSHYIRTGGPFDDPARKPPSRATRKPWKPQFAAKPSSP
jgi:hypothetical protein